MDDRNDLAWWHPRIAPLGVPLPRTEIVATTVDLSPLLDGETPDGYTGFLNDLTEKAATIGYPCFLRTGHTSAKHDWERSCYVPDVLSLRQRVFELVEQSALLDFLGLPTTTWVVRELLDLDVRFRAFRGTPIATERRFFVRDGKWLCSHFYWPEDSIRKPSTTRWRTLLREMERTSELDEPLLVPWAVRAGLALGGAWSVDFARLRSGSWVLIDMAEMDRSFHATPCPHAPH